MSRAFAVVLAGAALLVCQESRSRMQDTLDRALAKTGAEYVAAERDLAGAFRSGASAPVMRDPVAQLVVTAARNWNGELGADYAGALEYLDNIERWVKGTAVGTPPPEAVATYLERHYANRVAGLMALRLLKQPEWPRWKITGVLLYLRKEGSGEGLPALLRFVHATPSAEYRKMALEAIMAARDASLDDKIAAEKAALEAKGEAAPAVLVELEKRPK